MKKIIIISSSLRANSSSKILAEELIKGAKVNHDIKMIDLSKMKLEYCIGCLACQSSGKCVIEDSVRNVLDEISEADVLIFATPIYYYSISGQLKTFMDRLNPLYIRKNNFKEVYALFTCGDDNVEAIEGSVKAIEGWISCFNGVEYKGSFNGLGITSSKDITEAIKEKAYDFGNKIK